MGIGLEVFDAQGNSIFNTTSIVGRLIGVIDASAASGSAVVPGLDQGTPFAIPQLLQASVNANINTNSYPICTFNGNTVSWVRHAYPTYTALPGCNLILGVR